MSEVLLGVTLPQFTGDRERFVDGVQRAEALGFDSIWLFDHLWPLTGGKERPVIECWTALAWAAAATTSIGIGTFVTRSSLRHPALVAKMGMTVADIAPGRVTIAIGSGDEMSRDENESFGIPYYAEDDRIAQLASTVRCVHECLTSDVVTMSDEFVSIDGLPISPVPEQRPRLWVGGRSDDVIELAGTLADGWNAWAGGPKRFAQDAATLSGHAGGRPVELSWGGLVMLAENDAAASDKMGDRNSSGWIVGGPETVAARLRRYVEAGARHLIVTLPDPWRPGMYELLANEVKPRLN